MRLLPLERFTPWQIIAATFSLLYALRNFDRLFGLDGMSLLFSMDGVARVPDITPVSATDLSIGQLVSLTFLILIKE